MFLCPFSIVAEPSSRAAQKQPTERASICPHNRLKRAGQYPELLLLVQFYTWSCQFELQPEQDSNICPSNDWCYPEERCSIRGLHSIESSSTLRHQSQGSMPLWPSQLETSFLYLRLDAATHVHIIQRQKICLINFPASN